MSKRIGIVGMGLMGQAFITNLRKSQFGVQGFDLDPNRMDQMRVGSTQGIKHRLPNTHPCTKFPTMPLDKRNSGTWLLGTKGGGSIKPGRSCKHFRQMKIPR